MTYSFVKQALIASFSLLCLRSSTQHSNVEICRHTFRDLNSKMLINYQDEYPREPDSLLLKAMNLIKLNLFTTDHAFISCLDSNSAILKWYASNELPFIYGYSAMGWYKLFLYSLKYSGVQNEELVDSLWSNKELSLLPYAINNAGYNYLVKKFNGFTNCEDITTFLLSFYKDSIGFTYYFNLVNDHFSKVKECDDSYANYLWTIKTSTLADKDSIMEQEKRTFFANLDTSTRSRRFIRDQIFYNLPDSITIELLKRSTVNRDSIRNAIRSQMEVESRRRDSINSIFIFEDLSPEDQLQYLVASDTTLWRNGYSYTVMGDDGMRFDTFSNKELIKILDQLDFHAVYDTIQSELQINSNATTIHLQKIFQLLGDRFVYGSFKPTARQLKKLNKLVDFYADWIRTDVQSEKAREAIMQIMRLWNMMTHKYYEWLEDGNEELYHFVSSYLNPMIDESIVIEMIHRADIAEAEGNYEKALRYLMVVFDVYTSHDLDSVFKPERRPYRTIEESKRLSRLFVYPALQRFGIVH